MNANLKSTIKEAEEKRVAIGHFNISDITALRGIATAVRRISEEFHILLPVLIGVSEGEEKYIGRTNAVSLVKNMKDEGFTVFLNADHTRLGETFPNGKPAKLIHWQPSL